jgi:serine/threonine protein phosphatase PrpC
VILHIADNVCLSEIQKEPGKAAEALVKFAKRGEDKAGRDDTTAIVVEIR